MKIKHILRTDWLRRAPFSRLKPRTKDELNEVKSAPAGAVGATNGLLTANMIANGNGIGATFISAALGGTASMLTGGNFANGAVTAAFVTLFNTMAHSTTPQVPVKLNLSEAERETVVDNIIKALNAERRRNGIDYKEDQNGTQISKFSVDLGEGLPEGTVDLKFILKFGDQEVLVHTQYLITNNTANHTIVNFYTSKGNESEFRMLLQNKFNMHGHSFGFLKMTSKTDYDTVYNFILGK